MQTKASCAGRGHPARALRRPKVCRGQRGAHSRGLKRQQGGWANRRLALPPLGGELSPDGGGLVTSLQWRGRMGAQVAPGSGNVRGFHC